LSPGSRKGEYRVGKIKFVIMKKISNHLLVVVLTFSTIFFSCSKNESIEKIPSTTETFAEKRPHWAFISLTVNFGHNEINPHYQAGNGEPPILECIGWGVCKIQLNGINNNVNIGYPAKASNSLVIYFEKSTLDSQGIGSFQDLEITVYEDILITDSWIEDLGFKDDYTIVSGTYDVLEETDYLVVRF